MMSFSQKILRFLAGSRFFVNFAANKLKRIHETENDDTSCAGMCAAFVGTDTVAAGPGGPHGKVEERADLLLAPQRQGARSGRLLHRPARGQHPRGAAAARAGALPGAHGLQRHQELPRQG